MHLLLLIAAAFSSSFVAPNSLTVASTSIDAGVTHIERLFGIPSFTVTLSDYADLDLEWAIVDSNSDPTEAEKIPLTATGPATDVFTIAAVELTAFFADKNAFFIRVKNATGVDVAYSNSITIAAAQDWTLAGTDSVKDVDLGSLAAPIVITPGQTTPAEVWPETGVSAYLSWPRASATVEGPVKPLTVGTGSPKTYSWASASDLSGFGILTSDFAGGNPLTVTLHVKLADDVEHPKTKTFTIALEDAPAAFTVTQVTEEQLAIPMGFTLEALPAPSWDTNSTVKAIFVLARKKPATIADGVVAELQYNSDSNAAGWVVKTTDLYPIPVTADTKEIYVYFEETAATANAAVIANKVLTLKFVPEAAAPSGTFTLNPDEVEVEELAELTAPIVFEGSAGDIANWGALMRARFYYTDEQNDVKEVVVKVPRGGQAANAYSWAIPIGETALAGLDIEAATNVSVQLSPKGTRNYIAAPETLKVVGGTVTWSPNPTFFTFATPLVTEQIELVPSDGTSTLSGTHKIKFYYPVPEPTSNDEPVPKAETTVTVTSGRFYIAAGFNLAALGVLVADLPADIAVAITDSADAPVGDFLLEVRAAPVPKFTVVAPTTIAAADLANPIAFKIRPVTGQVWTDLVVKATVSLSKETPTGQSIPFTEILDAPTGEATEWTKDITLTGLVVPPAQNEVYVHIEVDGTYLTPYVAVPYTHPAALTFTIEPTTMEFAATLKTPLITIKPSDAARMPAADPKFVARFTKGTGTTAKTVDKAIDVAVGPPKVFTIPKDVDLADLEIKEADCPVTLKVSLWNDADEIGTAQEFKVTKVGGDAAMSVSPLLSLLAAALLLLVKLF